MLGRAGMCHYFGWLGTVVLLAVGSMEECMGGATTLTQTLGFWRGTQCLWFNVPFWSRAVFLFKAIWE